MEPNRQDADETANPRPLYLPTPEEIRQACVQIQAKWTPRERLKRQLFELVRHGTRIKVVLPGAHHEPIEVPVVRTGNLQAAADEDK
jgi:hypothetical protein